METYLLIADVKVHSKAPVVSNPCQQQHATSTTRRRSSRICSPKDPSIPRTGARLDGSQTTGLMRRDRLGSHDPDFLACWGPGGGDSGQFKVEDGTGRSGGHDRLIKAGLAWVVFFLVAGRWKNK